MKKLYGVGTLVLTIWLLVVLVCSQALAASPKKDPGWIALKSKSSQSKISVEIDSSDPNAGETITIEAPGAFNTVVTEKDGNSYNRFDVPGCGLTAEMDGFPQLPFKGFFLEIPYGVEVTINIKEKESRSLGSGYLVQPLQPTKIENNPSFVIDKEAYKKDGFYPENPVVLNTPGIIRGRRVVFVQVFPLQYNPATSEVRGFSKLKFHLKYKGKTDDTPKLNKNRLKSPFFDKLAEDLIINADSQALSEEPVSLSKEKAKSPTQIVTLLQSSSITGADYLIIAPDALVSYIQNFKQWKQKKGFITEIAPMSEVGSTWEDVKDYIHDAYDTWNPAPSFVLLLGDSGDIPPAPYMDFESDHPYACVDGSDYYPDLTLGRIPLSTTSDCTNVLNKIMKYDRTPVSGSWYDDVLSAAFFQDDNNDGRANMLFMDPSSTAYNFLVNKKGWDGHTAMCPSFWPLSHPDYHYNSGYVAHRAALNQYHWNLTPPQAYPNPIPQWVVNLWQSRSAASDAVTPIINAGTGLVLFNDHGGVTIWGEPNYNASDIASLNNGDKTPVILNNCCSVGAFYEGNSFCETFLKKYPGGCVGTVGSVVPTSAGSSYLIFSGMYTSFWPDFDPSHTDETYPFSRRPSEALNFGKFYMLLYQGGTHSTEDNFGTYEWFGDPEMMLRTTSPQTLTVDFPETIPVNRSVDIRVTVRSNGMTVGDARVCISHTDNSDYWSGLTDSQGIVTFNNAVFHHQDDYDIVVTAQDCYPLEDVIDVADLDECADALTLLNGADFSIMHDLYGSSMSSQSWPSCASPHSYCADVWYKFHPGSLKDVSILMYNEESEPYAGFVVYSGSCGSLSLVDCNDGNPISGAYLDFSTVYDDQKDYFIRVYGIPYLDGWLELNWEATTNDECDDAISIANHGDIYFNSQFYYATMGGPTFPDCASPESYSRDIWYKIHPGGGKNVAIEIEADTPGSGMVIYKGTCGELDFVGCGQGTGEQKDIQFYTLPDDNDDYFIRCFAHPYALGGLSVDWSTVPPGQMCIIPQSATCGSVFNWTNPIPGYTSDELPSHELTGQPSRGHWLELTIPAEKAATVHIYDHDLCQYVAIGFFTECSDPSNPFEEICEMEETSLTYINPSQNAVKIKVLVNYITYAAQPEMSVTCADAKYGQSCDLPQSAWCGSSFNNFSNPIRGSTSDVMPCFQSTGEPATGHWLSVDIPGRKVATVTAGIEEPMMSVGLGFYSSCGSVSSPFASICGYYQKSLSYINYFNSSKTIYVLENHNMYALENDITVDCTDATYGNACTNPRPISCGQAFSCQLGIPGETTNRVPCFTASQNVTKGHWLELTVPAYKTATIRLEDEDEMEMGIALYSSCNIPSSFITNNCGYGQCQVLYRNKSSQPVTIKILVNYLAYLLSAEISVTCN